MTASHFIKRWSNFLMNCPLTSFLHFYLQVIEQTLLCCENFEKHILKSMFWKFLENLPEMLIWHNVGKGWDCLNNLFSDLEKASISFKFKTFD